MPCFKPIRMWEYGGVKIFTDINSMPGPSNTIIPYHKRKNDKCTLIKCGQCRGCRMDYANEWATRVMLETKTAGQGVFATFTYKPIYVPKHLPENKATITYNDNGSLKEVKNNFAKYGFSEREKEYESIQQGVNSGNNLTLLPKDLTDLNKRIRKNFKNWNGDTNIRFYGCGEYGEIGNRPHYHVAYWGLTIKPEECYDYRRNAKNNLTWRNHQLDKCWSYDGKEIGFARIGNIEWNSAAYIARYILKKQKGKGAELYTQKGIKPEYTVMSLKPGIGAEYYFEEKEEIYRTDSVTVPRNNKSYTRKPPHYYDELLKKDDPEQLEYIKAKRREAADYSGEIITQHLNTDLGTYLKNCSEAFDRKTEIFMQRKGFDTYETI